MIMSTTPTEKTSAISLRIAINRKNLIDYAAKLIGNDRTTFIPPHNSHVTMSTQYPS